MHFWLTPYSRCNTCVETCSYRWLLKFTGKKIKKKKWSHTSLIQGQTLFIPIYMSTLFFLRRTVFCTRFSANVDYGWRPKCIEPIYRILPTPWITMSLKFSRVSSGLKHLEMGGIRFECSTLKWHGCAFLEVYFICGWGIQFQRAGVWWWGWV
jgi:hypothetical protein